MHKSSYMKMKYFKDAYLNPNQELKILDIGSFDKGGNYNYGMILNESKWTYQGLDMREGESYDLIVSGQAFEHIEFFWLTLDEIKRVLKPGGLFILIVPSTGPVHKNPYDCYRFNEDGVRAMAKYIKFDILESGTNLDEISDPWYDSYVVARKPGGENKNDLEERMDDIERKMDLILEKL